MINMVLIVIGSFRCAGVNEDEVEDEEFYPLFQRCCLLLQRTHSSVLQAMMRIIPFLTFGDEGNMKTLVNHFLPYLDFEK